MVPTANKDDGDHLEVVDLESGPDVAAIVDRQDSLFREAVRGEHHAGAGYTEQVRVGLVPLSPLFLFIQKMK
jgi:KUP system potassium uptake protein